MSLIKAAKAKVKVEKSVANKTLLANVKSRLSPERQQLLELMSEKGASNWINTLPIKMQDFYLDKQSFHDAILMRYGFDLPRLPSTCVCGSPFNVGHALTCNVGGFISIRHNDIRDRTANSF